MMKLAFLFVLTIALVAGSETTHSSLESRGLLGFAQFIWHYTGRNPLDYNDYGCWCGIGRKDTKTVDAVDECCKAHDACYENIFYLSVSSLCLNGVDTAEYKACMCDKTAAQCFGAYTYNSSWKGVCR
ncbi:unnamed protein product [Adineta ricciae]|uniref:Phosphatidylcholine 2-acylhydrolase n=1 Tax=Adineta ricciae TaxID=249248 RepID=A0A816FF06_ADIRI|nr:unnamed protein product [Adineta ricciae]